MGLDMYLRCNSREVCEKVNDQNDDWERDHMTPNGIAVQWRKANAIHRWFVTEVQSGKDDCGLYEVEVDDLVKLHDICKAVLDSTRLIDTPIENGKTLRNGEWVPIMEKGQKLEDSTVAEELLPTMNGFFFGPTAYDQWYWWDIQYTEKKLAAILDCLEPKAPWRVICKGHPGWYVKFYYTSSW